MLILFDIPSSNVKTTTMAPHGQSIFIATEAAEVRALRARATASKQTDILVCDLLS
jgi:hypothetical protein